VAAVAVGVAHAKVALSFDHALFLGVLCNVLVCLAVWLSLGARSTSDKILAVLFPVSAFVAAGFEHSVANMYLIPLGLFIKAWSLATLPSGVSAVMPDLSSLTWANFAWSLVPVTLGNLIGGGGLVGTVYWFVYLRPQGRA
jgi:formate/nitrite transporter